MYMHGMYIALKYVGIFFTFYTIAAVDSWSGRYARTYVTEGFPRGNSLGPLGTQSVACVHC